MIISQPKPSFLGVVFDVDHNFEGPRAPKARLDTAKEKLCSKKTHPLTFLAALTVYHFRTLCGARKEPPKAGPDLGWGWQLYFMVLCAAALHYAVCGVCVSYFMTYRTPLYINDDHSTPHTTKVPYVHALRWTPPSTGRLTPVMIRPWGEQRNATASPSCFLLGQRQ